MTEWSWVRFLLPLIIFREPANLKFGSEHTERKNAIRVKKLASVVFLMAIKGQIGKGW